ncbi:MAG: nucleoside kinase [Bacteroidaceae bacterium]|nr:nucleoside kinase [Bacteroidaceae bacterium]
MEQKVEIFCRNTQALINVNGGERLLDIYNNLHLDTPLRAVTARVNNKSESLDFRIYNNCDVEFVDISNSSGMRAYIRSLCFVLYKAVTDLYPGTELRIEHSISNGNYCLLNDGNEPVSAEKVARIAQRMREIIEQDFPFEQRLAYTETVIEIFQKQGLPEKVELLRSTGDLYTTYYSLDGLADIYYSWLVPSTGYLQVFDLQPYANGMLLLPPDKYDPTRVATPIDQQKMLNAFNEYTTFNRIIGIDGVGKLNRSIDDDRASTLIKVAEALHEKKIAKIAEEIAQRFEKGGARIVLISGPSSSGKTTFSKRLSIQLMTNRLIPAAISLDDYFVNRINTPLDESGDYDYESLYALDLQRFNSDLQRLLKGENVALPTYDFKSGSRIETGKTMQLTPNTVLILEGIHALNPELTATIDDAQKYRIYASALTSLSIDDHNWIPTTDNRLLRRIVRDAKTRGVSPKDTIARWNSVRRGEDRWIFPYQENADAMFNSSLLFELAVIREYAMPVLRTVPRNCPEYAEAARLLKFLHYFRSLPEKEIPPTSLLREFLGGSSFKY